MTISEWVNCHNKVMTEADLDRLVEERLTRQATHKDTEETPATPEAPEDYILADQLAGD